MSCCYFLSRGRTLERTNVISQQKYSWPFWLCEGKSYWRVLNTIIVASLVSSECATPFWITSEFSSVHSSFETTWTYHGLGSSPRWSFVSWIPGMTGGILRLLPFEIMRNHILFLGHLSGDRNLGKVVAELAWLSCNRRTPRKYQLSPSILRPCRTDLTSPLDTLIMIRWLHFTLQYAEQW